jgi:hypothetical protein
MTLCSLVDVYSEATCFYGISQNTHQETRLQTLNAAISKEDLIPQFRELWENTSTVSAV